MEVVLEIAVKELETELEKKNEEIRVLKAKNKILEEKVEELQIMLFHAEGERDAYKYIIERTVEMSVNELCQ